RPAALARVAANAPLRGSYHNLLHQPLGPELTSKLGPMTAHLWINDGLMAVFFLLVGLEIKREFVDGRLASWDQRRLPFIAAACGMVVPAAIYLAVIKGDAALSNGWAIPADRKSTRLNSSHVKISYAVFCLKKKKI